MRVIYTFLVLLALVSCRKTEDQFAGMEQNERTADSEYNVNRSSKDSFYLKARFNGTEVLWVVPAHKNDSSFTYHAGAMVGYSDYSNECLDGYCYYLAAYTQIFKNGEGLQPQFTVGFNMAAPNRSKNEIYAWFTPGIKTYQAAIRNQAREDLLNPAKNGLNVSYIDPAGKAWSSLWGSQEGSRFESLSFSNETRTDVSTEKVWKAVFSCWLYDNAGHSIKVDDGEICGPVGIR